MSNKSKNKKLTLGSLFDGIAGFPYAAERFGIETKWTSEIEPAPSEISARHFPNAKQLGDVTKINGAEIEPVDIISWGSPCTDLSVAGKREGLKGARSGLYVEAVRIIDEMSKATNGEYPKYGVFENVPGLLSSNERKDFITCLDLMQDIGFIPDPNILDAQFHGVPQRRKRVYITWVRVDYILKQRTTLSYSTILQLLTELLLINLAELSRAYNIEPPKSVQKDVSRSVNGLKKRMNLFSLQKENHLQMLQERLDEILAKLQKEQGNSDLCRGGDQTEKILSTRTDMKLENSLTENPQYWFTGRLLKECWEESCIIMKSSITSTWTKETIVKKISLYFQALLNTLDVTICYARYALMKQTSPNYFDWAKSALTEIKEYTNERNKYRKSFEKLVGNDLFGIFEQRLQTINEQVERYFRGQRAAEILFKPESVSGDIEESGETREGTAAVAESSS